MLTVGEGLETLLSLRTVLPTMPMLAGLSANHLAALELPAGVRCLYIARDNDPAGRRAEARLRERVAGQAIQMRTLRPEAGDFNVDLRRFGPAGLRARVLRQLVSEDRERLAEIEASWSGVPPERGQFDASEMEGLIVDRAFPSDRERAAPRPS